uniref:BTB/POZ domain-containing protein 9 n=1 Tax=Cacopsylla melanoneura TaxID=428564 RepID=A0A8D8W9Q6_9HEMI
MSSNSHSVLPSAGMSPCTSSTGTSNHSYEIEHVQFLSEMIGTLCLNDEFSDMVLVVQNEKIPVHKVILAARSEYFRALLYGGLSESTQNEIELHDTNIVSFKCLLKYIYSGKLSFRNLKEDVILDVLGLSHKYGFQDLENSISDYLRIILTVHNACSIFDCAYYYDLKLLKKIVVSFIDYNAKQIINQTSFYNISQTGLIQLIQRDSFFAPEIDIFRAVMDWIKANTTELDASGGDVSFRTTSINTDEILSYVRLPLISLEELLTTVRSSGIISADMILDAIEQQTNDKVQHRGYLKTEENLATSKLGTVVLQGEMKNALLNGDTNNYDMENGYTRHTITEPTSPVCCDSGILIKLGSAAIVNHIKLLLWDKDLRSYSYFIEVSIDQKKWTRVIDYTRFYCRSWQFIYFPTQVVQYIRVVGTNNTVNKVFHIVSFEIMFTTQTVELSQDGIIIPKHNVATRDLSAKVVEGVSRSLSSLIDGNISKYDWDSGYTCHQLGSGSILVQLGQPYMLDSMRLLLWDCDDRSYSYMVEVSVNLWDWEPVADHTRDLCRSWQSISFTRRPVVFIRIIGTHNTMNEVFHCVHFECPNQAVIMSTKGTTAASSSTAVVSESSQRLEAGVDTSYELREIEEEEERGEEVLE